MENKILKHLDKIKNGYLVIKTPCGNEIDVGNKNSDVRADIQINSWDVVDLVLTKGDIGFGEAYIKGIFSTTKIDDLLLFILINQQELEPLFHSNIFYSIFFGIKNLFKKNSLKGSKKNIEFHYDLGNDFYSLWLDETMSYSSGIFKEGSSLKESQINKYQRILDHLSSGKKILEIGCGWGGFINEANQKGFEVKGLTLSKEQKAWADKLIEDKKIKSKTALQDYRHEQEEFDNIVSIEMFEAVGKEYWDDYFLKIQQCLKREGRAVIQTIVIGDEFYTKYLKTSDYIREYIFPGGLLPCPRVFKSLAKKYGLKVVDEFAFGDSYRQTLLKWLDKFNEEKEAVLKLGYDEEFIRRWQFYLAYCAASFAAQRTDVIQYVLEHD